MSYRLKINNVDVSDFVKEIDTIPLININPDYTPTSEGYSFKLSISSGIVPSEGNKIIFTRNNVVIHVGVIYYASFDDTGKYWSVDVKHIFESFKSVPMTFDGFEKYLFAFTESINVSNYNRTLISHNNLINAIFSASMPGITLDWSTHYTPKNIVWWTHTGIAPSNQRTQFASGSTNDIYYIPNQVLNFNQIDAFTPRYNQSGSDHYPPIDASKTITSYDALIALSAITGYTYMPKSTSSFYVINDNTNYVIPADYDYGSISSRFSSPGGITISQYILYTQIAINGGYWFPEGAPQQWYESLDDAYNSGTRTIEYTYTTGSNPEAVSTIYNQLNPIILGYWDGITKHPYVAVPAVDTTNTMAYYILKSHCYGGVKYKMITKMSEILSQGFKNILRISVLDVNADLAEIEYIEYD